MLADLNGDGVADLLTANALGHRSRCASGLGGQIAPAGVTLVNQGASPVFTIAPQAGYRGCRRARGWRVAGQRGERDPSNVTAPHTIAVAFRSPPHLAVERPAGTPSRRVARRPSAPPLRGVRRR